MGGQAGYVRGQVRGRPGRVGDEPDVDEAPHGQGQIEKDAAHRPTAGVGSDQDVIEHIVT